MVIFTNTPVIDMVEGEGEGEAPILSMIFRTLFTFYQSL